MLSVPINVPFCTVTVAPLEIENKLISPDAEVVMVFSFKSRVMFCPLIVIGPVTSMFAPSVMVPPDWSAFIAFISSVSLTGPSANISGSSKRTFTSSAATPSARV